MNNVVRVVTRIQDQDDFQGTLVDGQLIKWDSSLSKFTLTIVNTDDNVIINPSSSARNVIQPSGSSFIPLVIKGAVSQSANLLNLTDNDDNVLVSITSTGVITGVGSGLTALNASNLSSGTVALARLSGITTTEISGSAGITNSQLANSAVTVTAGTGLTGGGTVSLGGTITLNAIATDYSTTVILVPGSSTRNIIQPSGSSFIPLVIKGAVSQSANLLNFIDSDDNVLVSITSTGVITGVGSGLTTLNASNLSSGTVNLARLSGITTTEISGSAGITNGQLANSSVTVTAGTGLIGGGTVSLGGTITLNAIATDYSPAVILAPGSSTRNIIQPTGATFIPLVIKGAVSQSANLLNFIDSDNTILAYVTSAGIFTGVGSGLTTLNASNLSSGTVNLARLSGITTSQLSGSAGITNGQLANSSVTVTAGTGLTGGGTVSLGGTITLNADATDYSTTVILAPGSSTRNIIQPTGAAFIPLVVKGAVSQSANLLNFIDSDANILAYVTSSGIFTGVGSGLTTLNASNLSSGTVALARLSGITTTQLSGTAGITNGQLANSSVTVTAGTGLTGGGTVSLGGTITLNAIATDYSPAVILAPGSSTRNVIQPTGATFIPLVVRGASSQSANLTEWQNSSNTIGARITSAMEFSNSSSAASSEKFGFGATTALSGTSIGYGATCSGTHTVCVGNLAAANTSIAAVLVGTNATASGTSSGTILIGYGTNTSGSAKTDSIAMGYGAAITANNQFVVGSTLDGSTGISNYYFGRGVTNSSPVNITFNATGGSGSNVAGANFQLAGGKGTGTGVGGNVVIQIAPAGSTGSSANSLVDVVTISSATQNVLVNCTSATIIPLVVRGASSQSANLTEWQDSSSNILLAVSNASSATSVYSSPVAGAQEANFGINTSNRLRFVTGGAVYLYVSGLTPLASDGTRVTLTNAKFLSFTSQALGTVGDVSLYRNGVGVLEINSGTASALRDLTCRSLLPVAQTATDIPLVVKLASSQSAHALDINSSSGSGGDLNYFDASGNLAYLNANNLNSGKIPLDRLSGKLVLALAWQ